jgi:hypothetical protein
MPLITGILSDVMAIRNKGSSNISKPKRVKSSKSLPSGGKMPQKSMESGRSSVRGSSLPCSSKVTSKTTNTSSKVIEPSKETSSSDSDMNSKSADKSKKRKKSGSEDNRKLSKLGSTKRKAEDNASAGAKKKKAKVTQEDPSYSKACDLTSSDETSDAEQSIVKTHDNSDVIGSEDERVLSEEGNVADIEDVLDTTVEAKPVYSSTSEEEGPQSILTDCMMWKCIRGPEDDIDDEVCLLFSIMYVYYGFIHISKIGNFTL